MATPTFASPAPASNPTSQDAPATPASSRPAGAVLGREWVMAAFNLFGLAIATYAYLMSEGHVTTVIGCTTEDPSGCAAIFLPIYSHHLFGLSIPLLGVVGYATILLTTLVIVGGLRGKRDLTPETAPQKLAQWFILRRALLIVAVGFSAYFMMFQLVFLGVGQLCNICGSSALAATALLLIDLTRRGGGPQFVGDKSDAESAVKQPRLRGARAWILAVVVAGIGAAMPTAIQATGWTPVASTEQLKSELLGRYPAASTPLIARDKPILVMSDQEGCDACTYFYGHVMQDERIAPLLEQYEVYRSTTPAEGTDPQAEAVKAILHIRTRPALRIVMPDDPTIPRDALIRTLNGVRDIESVLRFLSTQGAEG